MPETPFPKTGFEAGPRDTVVVETGPGKFRQAIQTSGHLLTADEPKDQGGGGAGPDPYDLLLSALGACTAMTIRMYADFKKLPLERVAVKLSHEKIHARDCRDCETETGMVDEIRREIEILGDDLTAENRQSILAIADKCPVHRTLTSEVKIRTSLA